MDNLIMFFIDHEGKKEFILSLKNTVSLLDLSKEKDSLEILNAIYKIPRFHGLVRTPRAYMLNDLSLDHESLTESEIEHIILNLKNVRLSRSYFNNMEKLKLLIKVTVAKGFLAHIEDAADEYNMKYLDYQNLMDELCGNGGTDLRKFVFVIDRFVKNRFTDQEYLYWNRCLI